MINRSYSDFSFSCSVLTMTQWVIPRKKRLKLKVYALAEQVDLLLDRMMWTDPVVLDSNSIKRGIGSSENESCHNCEL